MLAMSRPLGAKIFELFSRNLVIGGKWVESAEVALITDLEQMGWP